MGVGLHERVLHGVLGVFAVARDVHSQPEDFPLVTTYELFKGGRVAGFCGGDKQGLVVTGDCGRKTMWIRLAQSDRFRQAMQDLPVGCIRHKGSTKHGHPNLGLPSWMSSLPHPIQKSERSPVLLATNAGLTVAAAAGESDLGITFDRWQNLLA